MLTRQLLLKGRLPRLIISKLYDGRCYASKSNPSASTELDIESIIPKEVRLSSHKPKQQQREPFAKNLFMGKYDTEICAFPEPQTNDRQREFFEWLKPIEDYVDTIDMKKIDEAGEIPADIIENMKQLDVLRAAIPEEYKGLDLNNSEYTKLVETFSRVPVLGAYLVKRIMAIDYIIKFASEELQARYLPKIANGELFPTLCINEDEKGTDDSPIVSKAVLSNCENFWHIKGKKCLVPDAKKSNLFIVLVECSEDNNGSSFKPDETTTAFIVEKEFGNISIDKPADTVGLRGLDLCNIHFNDTVVPKDNMVGEIGTAGKAFAEIFSEGKHYIGAQAVGLTKSFLKAMIKNLKNSQNFNTLKFQNDTIQDVVSRMVCSIYGMESVTYLTCGLMDTYADQDCILERCITETYCADQCIQSILNSMQVLGVEGHTKTNEFQQYFRDAICLTTLNGPITSTKSLISLLGLQHTGKAIGEEIKVKRNLWNFPSKAFKLWMSFEKKEKLHIADNLHPSLELYANLLEEGIFSFKQCVGNLAWRDGMQLLDRPVTLRRMTDTATYLYVMASVVARSSRSYCLGMRESEIEIKISQIFAFIIHEKYSELMRQLDNGEWINGDSLMKDVSDGCFQTNDFYPAHPLARNF